MNKIIYRNLVLESKDLISGNCVLNHAATGENLIADTRLPDLDRHRQGAS